MELSQAYEQVNQYEYAYVYMMSKMVLCKVDELPLIDWEECLEARFFSEDRELHIFEGNDGMQAVLIEDGDSVDCNIRSYELVPKFKGVGKELEVQEYLDFDEDGQIYVVQTRLKGIK
jgi:hypothetical protein